LNHLYYNIHSHRKPQGIKEVCIRNAFLTRLGRFEPNYFLSTGLHPWHVSRFSTEDLLHNLRTNCKNKQVKAIGEIGLDKYAADYEIQKKYFELQVTFAAQQNFPIIIHQVKSVEGIELITKDFYEPIILHGFNGHLSVWEQLNKNGNTYISIGSNSINPSSKLLQAIQEIPLEKLFIETDNASVLVQTVYKKIADIRGITLQELVEAIAVNFNKVFNPN